MKVMFKWLSYKFHHSICSYYFFFAFFLFFFTIIIIIIMGGGRGGGAKTTRQYVGTASCSIYCRLLKAAGACWDTGYNGQWLQLTNSMQLFQLEDKHVNCVNCIRMRHSLFVDGQSLLNSFVMFRTQQRLSDRTSMKNTRLLMLSNCNETLRSM